MWINIYIIVCRKSVYVGSRMVDAKLEAVPAAKIDEGIFKYVLIKVYGKEQADGTEPSKLIVRGFERAEWHGKSVSCLYVHL